MILCAGLTPAWQHILVFDSFRYGEVNRARQAYWCASGKVFNAAIAAHRLGGPTLALAPVGGPMRPQIEGDFARAGVPYRWVVTAAPTRVCTTLLDRGSGKITELVEDGLPLQPEELAAFSQAYAEEAARADVAVLIGSLPAGTPPTYYRHLLERTPCPAVLDFRGEGLLAALERRPLVVKPNREELGQTVGRPLRSAQETLEAMRDLVGRGAQWVVVTHGAEPVLVASPEGAWETLPLRVETVVNAIGCGDVMAAALAWAIRAGWDVLAGVKLAVAAAAANLRQLFPGRLDPAGVWEAAKGVTLRRLQ